MTNTSLFLEIYNFELKPFSVADFAKWHLGGHLATVFGVTIKISMCNFILQLKQFALVYSSNWWLFLNSQ